MMPAINPLFDTPEVRADLIKWVEALRSGRYKQTTGQLQSLSGYCCLGVACREFIAPEKLYTQEAIVLRKNAPTKFVQILRGHLPNICQPAAPTWLKTVDDEFQIRQALKVGGDYAIELSSMNDKAGASFEDIAACIEDVFDLPKATV
jgi:hypothetical protein